MIDESIRAERERLERDIALRHRMKSLADLDDLLLRVGDVIESIKFNLNHEGRRPRSARDENGRAEWRGRATRALEKYEMVLGQVQRRRDYLAGQDAPD